MLDTSSDGWIRVYGVIKIPIGPNFVCRSLVFFGPTRRDRIADVGDVNVFRLPIPVGAGLSVYGFVKDSLMAIIVDHEKRVFGHTPIANAVALIEYDLEKFENTLPASTDFVDAKPMTTHVWFNVGDVGHVRGEIICWSLYGRTVRYALASETLVKDKRIVSLEKFASLGGEAIIELADGERITIGTMGIGWGFTGDAYSVDDIIHSYTRY